MLVTLRNKCHNTNAVVRVGADLTVKPASLKRAQRKLCSTPGCCGHVDKITGAAEQAGTPLAHHVVIYDGSYWLYLETNI